MRKVTVGKYAVIENGYAFKSSKYVDTGARIIRIANVQKGEIFDNNPKFFPLSELDGLDHFKIRSNDLLMSLTGNVGRVGRFPSSLEPAYLNQRVCRIKTDEKNLDSQYIFHYFNSCMFETEAVKASKGIAQLNLSTKWIEQHEIPLPPLPEQKRIAAMLDKADALRQKNKQLLAAYDELLQATFLEMFGDPVTNPKGWEKTEAEGYIELITGYPFKSKDYIDNGDGVRLCGGLIIMPWGIEWEKAKRWSRDKLNDLDSYWLEKGDIVMAMDRPWISSGFKIAQIKENDLPSLLVQRTACIRSKNMDQSYIYFLLQSNAFEHHVKITETTVPHISPKDIKKFLIPVPPIELQNKFAQIVENIEAQKALVKKSLQESEDLFGTLVQNAFSGAKE